MVLNLLHRLNGTTSEIKEKFPVDKIYAMFQGKPAVFEGKFSNETKVVKNPSKQDYLKALDDALKSAPIINGKLRAQQCWFISIQGPAMNRHWPCGGKD